MEKPQKTRREFLKWLGMWGSVAASYGLAAIFGFRFIFPRKRKRKLRSVYVTQAGNIDPGKSYGYVTPEGQTVLINKIGDSFKAFSNVCPHLGCKVKWQADNNVFHCPCHDGKFNAKGVAIAGPPKAANQTLTEYPMSVKGESLYLSIDES